ncbi:hypothetical protein [Paraburkholderia sp. BL21I4N1]|uniref:hypothetical protein n=1 Tax=Paraburkholderia sp. BL21I4N1 TaxID=1938801 RepID=UPI000CFB806A|nr:hypothetical protein [Paraburkholderia sp. BL21I4N1]PQV54845.1 hypothetical protein B0G83_1011028 [Paraburkholderia sp. BL21I4N1]
MSDIIHAHNDDASCAPYSPHSSNDGGGGGPLDSKQALMAHLTGLCCGALVILGTTAAVCAVLRLL